MHKMDFLTARPARVPAKNASTNSAAISQLEDFLHRANKANIRTAEPSPGSKEETWEVLDRDVERSGSWNKRDENDRDEWVIVDSAKSNSQLD